MVKVKMVDCKVHLRLLGRFCATTDDGRDVTPRGKKAVGLLAMLAEPNDKIRNRRWLEDKLWSDRGPQQAQGSLRTTLSEIRRSFGSANVLKSDRNAIWLDVSAVTTDLGSQENTREFLEGLDIVDPEFNHWLSEMRIKYGPTEQAEVSQKAAVPRVQIHCRTPNLVKTGSGHHATIVGDQVGAMIAEFIAHSSRKSSGDGADLVVDCAVDETNHGSIISVRVINAIRDEILHSTHTTCESLYSWLNKPDLMGQFCWNTADTALEKLSLSRRENNVAALRAGFVQDALNQVLSFDAGNMRNGLKVLDDAAKHLESGVFLALKAWSIASLILENVIPESIETLEEVDGLLRRALEISPGDMLVISLSASTRASLMADYASARKLAVQALRHNPNNLLALQAFSTSLVAQQKYEDAYARSKLAVSIASSSKFEARCHLHHSLLCIVLGKTEEAVESARSATECNPNYRAPKRQLLALLALENDVETCRRLVSDLQLLEPGFSLDQYVFDQGYHTHTLRKTGLLKQAKPYLVEVEQETSVPLRTTDIDRKT